MQRISTVLTILCLTLLCNTIHADKGTDLKTAFAKSDSVTLQETFSESKLGKHWVVSKGSWTIQDGAVVGREKKEDMHAAVLTLQHPHRDSSIRFSFRLDGTSGFTLSFNHAKGHLFRIIVNSAGISISKDKDKKDPASKAVSLAKSPAKFESGQWYTLLVETSGDKVSVRTDTNLHLEARDPALNTDKTGYGFVTRGESLLLDDVRVWNTKLK